MLKARMAVMILIANPLFVTALTYFGLLQLAEPSLNKPTNPVQNPIIQPLFPTSDHVLPLDGIILYTSPPSTQPSHHRCTLVQQNPAAPEPHSEALPVPFNVSQIMAVDRIHVE